MSHANARPTPKGRLKPARLIVDDDWSLRRATERLQVSVPTAKRWADRYRELGEDGMAGTARAPAHDEAARPVRLGLPRPRSG